MNISHELTRTENLQFVIFLKIKESRKLVKNLPVFLNVFYFRRQNMILYLLIQNIYKLLRRTINKRLS